MTLLSVTVPPSAGGDSGRSVRKRLRGILITGFALTVPVIVTLMILQFVVDFIPGVGSVYTSFNEMTEMLLSNETQSVQEVKLVEYPVEGSYTLGFVTADSPPEMGGHVLHVSGERVYDVDPTVEKDGDDSPTHYRLEEDTSDDAAPDSADSGAGSDEAVSNGATDPAASDGDEGE